MTKNDRKLILVRTDLLEKASKITAKEGRTLFSFTNEAFEQAIAAHDIDVTLAETLEFYTMMKIEKSLGYVAIPSSIFNQMAQRIPRIEREKTLNEWYEFGVWNGNYLNRRFHDQNKLEMIKSFMKASLRNLDEFTVNVDKDRLKVNCLSRDLNLESAEMLAKFLNGIFNSLGYVVKRNSCLRGMVNMELEHQEQEGAEVEHSA